MSYIDCAADTQGAFFAIGAALAGSEEKAAVLQELLDNYVEMFTEVLSGCGPKHRDKLEQRCVGLVGAGESLSSELIRGRIDRADATDAFPVFIRGALSAA